MRREKMKMKNKRFFFMAILLCSVVSATKLFGQSTPIDLGVALSNGMEDSMGTFLEKIILVNSTDQRLAKSGYIPEDQIRTMEVEAMPDTGAWTLIINDKIRRQLGLETDDPASRRKAGTFYSAHLSSIFVSCGTGMDMPVFSQC